MRNTITTGELLSRIDSNNIIIIDVRQIDAYNGWKQKGELRGGHIKGAKSLPIKWCNYIDWIEVVHSKHILPENNIILYGYTKDESQKVAERFDKAGYKNITLYYNFIDEWSANTHLPMETLKRYKQLVSLLLEIH